MQVKKQEQQQQQQPRRVLVALFLFTCAFILVEFGSFTSYSHAFVGDIYMDPLEYKVTEPQATSLAISDGSPKKEGLDWVSTKRKLAYVDIATADGSAILEAFRTESVLSEAVHLDVALKDLPSSIELEGINAFLLDTSNPVRRALHAYNQLHPANTTTSLEADEFRRQFYKDCYPSLNQLLDGISVIFERVKYYGALDDCQELAIQVLQGKEEKLKNVNQYLFYNNGFYLANSIEKHPFFDVFVVRREVIWEDLASLDKFLGFAKGGFPKLHDEALLHIPSPSKVQNEQLCCILWQDLDRYQQIMDRAQNLSPEDKENTLIDLIDTCSVISDKDSAASAAVILREGYGVNWSEWHKLKCPDLKPFFMRKIGH